MKRKPCTWYLQHDLRIAVTQALLDGFEFDLFSTFLSRKHSYHRTLGHMKMVKMRKA